MVFFLLYPLALIASYALIGAGIKYLDQQTDLATTHKMGSWLLTLSLGLLVNIWSLFDAFTAILAIALVFGLLGARKIDNIYFIVLAIISLPVCLITLLQLNLFLFTLPVLLTLILPVILDELLHSLAPRVHYSALQSILRHRPLLKIVVLVLPFFGLLTFVHTIAFWSFDIAYDLVNYLLRASNPVKEEAYPC